MRCLCCNKNLSDKESTLKHAVTGKYLDTCFKCLKGLGIPYIANAKLADVSPDEELVDIDMDIFEENNDDF